jgi:CheY-like chemotaxis protein
MCLRQTSWQKRAAWESGGVAAIVLAKSYESAIAIEALRRHLVASMVNRRNATRDETGRGEPVVRMIGVVDDEQSVRDALSSLVRSVGYRCSLFASAEAFLRSGQLNETDCMLLDTFMPGLTGLELQTRLRQMNCAIPIIFITGSGDDDLRARAIEQGAIAVLPKTVNHDALLGAIADALQRRPD